MHSKASRLSNSFNSEDVRRSKRITQFFDKVNITTKSNSDKKRTLSNAQIDSDYTDLDLTQSQNDNSALPNPPLQIASSYDCNKKLINTPRASSFFKPYDDFYEPHALSLPADVHDIDVYNSDKCTIDPRYARSIFKYRKQQEVRLLIGIFETLIYTYFTYFIF